MDLFSLGSPISELGGNDLGQVLLCETTINSLIRRVLSGLYSAEGQVVYSLREQAKAFEPSWFP
jgi:hypothetical protein